MGLKGISFGVETARQRERECDKERQRLCTREREREAILFFVSSLLSHIHSIRMRNKECAEYILSLSFIWNKCKEPHRRRRRRLHPRRRRSLPSDLFSIHGYAKTFATFLCFLKRDCFLAPACVHRLRESERERESVCERERISKKRN